MHFDSSDDLKTLIIHTANEYQNQELFALLMNVIRLSSFEIIPFDPAKPETAQGTAYIKRLGMNRYQVKFYQKFIETYLHSGDDCVFVLLHELSHWQQGDLIRSDSEQTDPMISNIVADMLINARLCRNWFPQGVPFFDRFYSNQDGESQTQEIKLFGHFLMPPQSFFTLYAPLVQKYSSDLQAPVQAPTLFDYQLYSKEHYGQYRTLIYKVLSELYGDCTPMCVREVASIYCLAWFGRTAFRPLYRRVSALLEGKFDGCLSCTRCDFEDDSNLDSDLDSSTASSQDLRDHPLVMIDSPQPTDACSTQQESSDTLEDVYEKVG